MLLYGESSLLLVTIPGKNPNITLTGFLEWIPRVVVKRISTVCPLVQHCQTGHINIHISKVLHCSHITLPQTSQRASFTIRAAFSLQTFTCVPLCLIPLRLYHTLVLSYQSLLRPLVSALHPSLFSPATSPFQFLHYFINTL